MNTSLLSGLLAQFAREMLKSASFKTPIGHNARYPAPGSPILAGVGSPEASCSLNHFVSLCFQFTVNESAGKSSFGGYPTYTIIFQCRDHHQVGFF